MSCRSVRGFLHLDASSLDAADGLLLEEHLENCVACQRAREQLFLAKQIAQAMPIDPLGSAGQQRAIAKAMLRGAEPVPRASSRSGWMITGGVALAGIAVLVVWLMRDEDRLLALPESPIATAADAAAPTRLPPAHVEVGQLTVDSVAVAIGEPVPADTPLRAEIETLLVLPAGRFTLAAATELRWSSDSVMLDSGAIDVDVGPRATALRVVTDKFAVAVVGTAFRVTPRAVTVTRGVVQIFASDSTILVPRLAAGETWTLDEPPPPTVSATTLLDRARRAFVARDCRSATDHANAALAASPTRPQAADARTLLAECAQAANRLDQAVRLYDTIAARFADLPAGETALIAAARIELARGNRTGARTRFERYVKRYPQGRLVDDARRQLETIQP